MKIPTLLALSLIIIAVVLGVGLFFYYQQNVNKSKPLFAPIDIAVVNITSTSATITWQTNQPVIGNVAYDSNPSILSKRAVDERDISRADSAHIVHFVTIKDLTPNSKYYYQIKSGPFLFPQSSQEFKTAITLDSPPPSQNTPLRGVVLEADKPIDEALVTLKIAEGSPLSTYTTTAGNFILPLSNLRTKNLLNYFNLPDKTPALLEIVRGQVKSQINLNLPMTNQSLPSIKLGENLDLRNLSASQSAIKEQNTTPATIKYDLNSDGKVNAVDLSIVLDNLGRTPKDKRADFNGDGIVDQKDIDLIEKALQ